MGQLVKPKVFFVGCSEVREKGLKAYLEYTNQMDFWETYQQALAEGLQSGEALCSVYAKLCYQSLTLGKNSNVTRIRDVRSNLENCHTTGHGSVFEHCQLNFIVTGCSRVYTHEQARHRSGPPKGEENALDNDLPGDGWAYSQTSGRYCRLDKIDMVWSDLLDPVKELWQAHLGKTEDLVYLTECKLGLRKPSQDYPDVPPETWLNQRDYAFSPEIYNADKYKWVPDNSFDFDRRKAITSAIRRIAPNGQSNEMGMSVNVRALRHVVQVRTSRFAETEIRDIYAQIYHLLSADFPTLFYGAKVEIVGGLPEICGMKIQPYELEAGDPKALKFWTSESLAAELQARDALVNTKADLAT